MLRDSWGLTWLKLAPGSHTVSFTHVEGSTEPAAQTVTITTGGTTVVTGTFSQRGSFRVLTTPPCQTATVAAGNLTTITGTYS